jgi:phospholipid/cholesterol/gamma-HCH transport system substrate-binding protein
MKKYHKETVVGIFVVIGLICIGYMTVKLGNVGFFGDSTYSLFAKFNTVTGLREGNPVNMLGLKIGRVHKFTMDQEGQVVQVEFKINKGIEIFDDAIASIKTEGLIGDKYVAVDPGGGGDLLANGDTITDTNSPIDIMDLVSKYAFGDVGGEGAREDVEDTEVPEFPWPPPNASAKEEIPDQFLRETELRQTLQNINQRLRSALDKAGYFEKSYFSVPEGFAIVTRLEQINADGTSKPDRQRWATKVGPLREFSLSAYLQALFESNIGYFRVIVFIVTNIPFSQADTQVDRDQALGWQREGLNRLPLSIGSLPYSKDHYCTALIYEFEKIDSEQEAVAKIPGRHIGRNHLIKSKLWSKLER